MANIPQQWAAPTPLVRGRGPVGPMGGALGPVAQPYPGRSLGPTHPLGGAIGHPIVGGGIKGALKGVQTSSAVKKPLLSQLQLMQHKANIAKVNALTPEQKMLFANYVNHLPGQDANIAKLRAMNPAQLQQFGQFVHGAQGGAGAASPPLHLGAAQEGIYSAGRNTANEQYNQGLADNEFQRGQASQQFASQLRDLTQQYGQARNHLPDQYVGRGILGSGVEHQQLQDLVQQRLRMQGDVQNQQAGAMSAYDIARTGLERQRASQLAAIEAQRQQAMANLASGSIK